MQQQQQQPQPQPQPQPQQQPQQLQQQQQKKNAFLQVWPKWFVIILGVIELLAVAILFITELGNIAANFWTTNVFAGGWCGLVMIVHFFALFVAGCCVPGPASAFRAFIITLVALVACAALISFDAVFIALPSTCILTSSCASNAASTTLFSYYFRSAFFTVFNNLGPFSSYTQTQTKFLFQVVQLGVGSLCFALCIIYIILYFVSRNKAGKQVGPGILQAGYAAPQPNRQQPGSNNYQQQQPRPGYPQQPGPGYPQQPRPSYPQQPGPGYPQQPRPAYPAQPRPSYPPQASAPEGPSAGNNWQQNKY